MQPSHEEALKIFHQSYHRCLGAGGFFERFYESFMASSAAIGEKFKNTDFRRQHRALEMSLHMMALAGTGNDAVESYLDYLAERHNHQHLNIEPPLYGNWLESLLVAVREIDPDFDPDIESAWRHVMQPGIDYLVSRY
ncbi:MAG: globin [Gammaproteobacteria bacterium]|jgi:hemoglobin-like flavoprotein|nr:globin [Gammaproteobacteria bacterium]